ncbi:MAG: 2-dehydropantoate 2-reductase [Candidatus Poribacteria bacterium]|nr:2-dehydropantoate 2-reductase [Candidatus Poribacteria bacterium]
MKIAVIGGGGAMGGILGGTLIEAGNEVVLVDVSEPVVRAINTDGLTIEDREGNTRVVRIAATTDPSSVGTVELALVFVKCYHTEAAVRAAMPMIGDDTAVLSLQNGWGNAPRIASVVGEERVLVGVTYHSGTLVAPGHVKHAGAGATFLGELNGARTDRLERIAATLAATGFEVHASDNVLLEIWKKLALNVCTLPTSALLRFYAGQLVQHDGTLALMRSLLTEAVAVAHAQDIPLDIEERWASITGLLERATGAKASMLQDVEARRRTEIDVVNGAIVEAGQRLGIPTPHNDAIVWLVRSLEANYEKK